MSRVIKSRKLDNTIAIIVDGSDEKWYIETIKSHYSCSALKRIKVEPELPHKKKIQELFELAKTKYSEGYKHIILIIDFDTTNKESKEIQKFKELYKKYNEAKNCNKSNWIQSLTVIINNPCLEFWYLMHFKKTAKFYQDFNDLKNDLLKYLIDYKKDEQYYKGHPDIYTRLNGDQGIIAARKNTQVMPSFCIETCKTNSTTGMASLFDFFDSLQ